MSKHECLASDQLAINAVGIRTTDVGQTKIGLAPESGIWPGYHHGGREIESGCWVQPVAVPLTPVPEVKRTTPKAIASMAGSIVCLGDLDVAEAADLTAQGGIARLVTRVLRSLRRAELDVVATSLGAQPSALQIQHESTTTAAIFVSTTEVLALAGLEREELERPGPRHVISSDGRRNELTVPTRYEIEVDADLKSLGLTVTRSLVSAIFAEYSWVNVPGLGRVSFVVLADAPLSAKPHWVVVFAWMSGAAERATLGTQFHALAGSLGFGHSGKLGALDKGRPASSASPAGLRTLYS